MRYFLLFVFALAGLTAYSQSKKMPALKYDTSKIAIIPLDSIKDDSYYDTCKPANAKEDDFAEIETILNLAIEKFNKKWGTWYDSIKKTYPASPIKIKDLIIDFRNYRRQYVFYYNKRGQKCVWINCFCSSEFEGWKKYIVFVFDGGKCFFNVRINLSFKVFFDFCANGDA
jgi:hypothetical protein